MEYRRRRRDRYRPRKGGPLSAYLLIGGTAALLAYLFSASEIGGRIAGEWLAPALARASDADTGAKNTPVAPSPSPTVPERVAVETEIVMPAVAYYALQIGVYTSRDNADKQSAELKRIGAAGYVREDGGRYRVLAAAYPDRESMEKVASQLRAEGIESAEYLIECAARTLTVTAGADDAAVVQSAAGAPGKALTMLYDAAIAFDRDGRTVEEGVAAAGPCLSLLTAELGSLDRAAYQNDAETRALCSLLQDLCAAVEPLQAYSGDERAGFSAALKGAFLTAAFACQAYASH